MSKPEENAPRTNPAASGGPPKPPKKTARGLAGDDDRGDPRKELSPEERAELARFLKGELQKHKKQ